MRALYAAYAAGQAVLEIYDSGSDPETVKKADDSPLTAADRRSHEIITRLLNVHEKGSPGNVIFPILSEEGKDIPYEERRHWNTFWLVDPLDGTKEFLNRNGEFTVNIALVSGQRPVLGVVYVPVTAICYFGINGRGAYRCHLSQVDDRSIQGSDPSAIISASERLPLDFTGESPRPLTVVASRSHMNRETEEYIEGLRGKHGDVRLVSAGSSLKFCMVAEESADIYPRLGPTMEWDTAAAHAVVAGAGKRVTDFHSGDDIIYNKEDLHNPWFVVE